MRASSSTRYRSFNVSKLFSICGILLLTFGYDFNWIASTLVAADKHTYGSIDSNGLCLPRFFFLLLFPLFSARPAISFPYISRFFCCVIQFIKAETISHQSKNQTTIFPAEVILNRRIIERKSSVPTNYTIIYKYVRNRMGGQISYIEFDVANCVSNRLAFDCRHVTCRIKSTSPERTGVYVPVLANMCSLFCSVLCVCCVTVTPCNMCDGN